MNEIKPYLRTSETAEIIMRALAAYNQAPGSNPDAFDLGRMSNPTLMRYWNMANQVEAALRRADRLR